MLFIGHFSFASDPADRTPSHGFFYLLVDAPTPEAAVQRFRRLIRQHQRTAHMWPRRSRVILEDCLQVRQLPRPGMIGHFRLSLGSPPAWAYASAPGVRSRNCITFSPNASEGEEGTIEPFLTFR